MSDANGTDGIRHGSAGHECVACREIVREGPDGPDGAPVVRFGPRFQGPPGNANGGVVAGVLTCLARRLSPLDDPAVARLTARLHRGIPQGRDLTVGQRVDPDGLVELTLSDGDTLLVTGAVELVPTASLRAGRTPTQWGEDRIEPLVSLAEPTPAQRDFASTHPTRTPPDPNPFAHCFVCGADNGAGLRVGAQPVAPGLAWASNPHASAFAESDGRLDTVVAVASLDCPSTPSFYALPVLGPDESVLLGTFDVEFVTVPPAEVEGGWRLPSRYFRRDGRRIYADIALVDRNGALYALATATWITVPTPAAA